jgi:peptide/nickel transport system permease protein
MMAKSRRLYLALGLLSAMHALVLGAGFFAPYDPDIQNRELPFAPPTRLRWVDAQGKFHPRPFVYPYVTLPEHFGVYETDTRQTFSIHFFVRSAQRLSPGLHTHWHLFGTDGGARIFLLGTDRYGRDQFSRLLYGGQVSLLAALVAGVLSLGLGLLLGSVAGFYGGFIDDISMRLAELFLALPWLYLLFAVRAFLPLHTPPRMSVFIFIMVVGILGWARPARLVRGVVLSAKERNFVLAARGFGASEAYLLRRHVLPQTFGVVLAQAGLLIPHYILAEVALSYLGLGVGEPLPSLGNMLAEIQTHNITSSHWWMLLPGLALVLLLVGYYSLVDALHERAELVQV